MFLLLNGTKKKTTKTKKKTSVGLILVQLGKSTTSTFYGMEIELCGGVFWRKKPKMLSLSCPKDILERQTHIAPPIL